MGLLKFSKESRIETSAERAFAWHEREGALERLIPPWESIRVVERTGGIRDGGRVVLAMKAGLLPIRWVAEHHGYDPPNAFRDTQVRGPFKRWEHLHRFAPAADGGCLLKDEITFALPLGALGRLLGGGHVRKQLERTFAYRHTVTTEDLALHERFADRPRKKVALSGASGLVGAALAALLTTGGHDVVKLVRRPPRGADEIQWDAERGVLEPERLVGLDAVIHLAGENIAAGRWTEQLKARIRDSRVVGTRKLVDSLAECTQRPPALLCASALGYYGNRGDEVLNERSAAGHNFLAEVCTAWEAEAARASDFGMRVVNLRIGIVLSPQGGMLQQVLPIFKLGGGGPVGPGTQWLSWISLDDVIGATYHALMDEEVVGAVNLVAPGAVTNAEFGKTLGRVLKRPAIVRAPSFALKLMLGEMAEQLILGSTRVTPEVLLGRNYVFRHTSLESALRHLLGRTEGRG